MSAQLPATVNGITVKLESMKQTLATRSANETEFRKRIIKRFKELTQELDTAKASAAALQGNIESSNTEMGNLNTQIITANEEHGARVAALTAATTESNKQLKISMEHAKELIANMDILKASLTSAKVDNEDAIGRVEQAVADVNRLTVLVEQSKADAEIAAVLLATAKENLDESNKTIATLESDAEEARAVQSTTATELNTINDLISGIEQQILELPTVPNDAVDFQEFLDKTKFGGMRKSRRNVKKSKKTIKALVRRKRTLKK